MITMQDMVSAAEQLLAAETATAEAEAALKAAKEKERQLREEVIPGMFDELGIKKMTLEDGSTFSIKDDVYAAPPADRKSEMYAWLAEHNFDGIIKTEVSVAFGKGEIELAMKLMDDLASELGITDAKLDRSIHHQTLTAFLRERIADMDENAPKVDLDLFGARPVSVATVKAPPKPRIPKARPQPGGGQVHEYNG